MPATLDREIVQEWFEAAGSAMDGIIAKKLGIAYSSGDRNGMVKVKRMRTADCVVGGYRRSGSTIGSLLFGLYDKDGLLYYVGHTSGFSTELKKSLYEKLSATGLRRPSPAVLRVVRVAGVAEWKRSGFRSSQISYWKLNTITLQVTGFVTELAHYGFDPTKTLVSVRLTKSQSDQLRPVRQQLFQGQPNAVNRAALCDVRRATIHVGFMVTATQFA